MYGYKPVVIFTAKKAKQLLKRGYRMIDIKPDNTDPDRKRSVFIFEFAKGILD